MGDLSSSALDERYGRRPRPASRRHLAAALVVFVAVALAWAAWVVTGMSRSSVSVRQVTVDASDPSLVKVSFEVSLPRGRSAVCAVRATDATGAVVGWTDVPVARTASGAAAAEVAVRTSLPAAGGGVSACIAR